MLFQFLIRPVVLTVLLECVDLFKFEWQNKTNILEGPFITSYTIYCKLFKVEKFCSFHGLIGNHETFPVKWPVQ